MTTVAGPEEPSVERASVRSLTLIEAVREALREEMRRDERVVLLGEDIGALGGVFRATDGLLAEFGADRVIDTPMMELGIAGLAVGMAMRGMRPVAEIQFADFMHAAADHIISDAARVRFRTNGDAGCPLVIRTAYGGGLRGGPYHSQSIEAYYAHVPGLRVVVASTPADAKGLLTAAMRHPDPVLFLEHKRTYRAIRGDVPAGEYVLPLDRANVVRPGRDLTLVSWGWVLHESLAAAETLSAEGIEVEVIDPRTLNPLDHATLVESVRRTGRLCVVHEDTRTMGVGAEVAALIAEQALDALRAPVERIAMADVAGIPASGPMEDFLIPDRARIATTLRRLARTSPPAWSASSDRPAAPEPEPAPALTPVPEASSVIEIDLSMLQARMAADHAQWLQRGLGPTPTPYFADALLEALRDAPQTNAVFDPRAGGVRHHVAVHLGLSIADPTGAHARHAVLHDADTRNVLGLAVEIASLQQAPSTADRDVLDAEGATVTLVDYGPDSALFGAPAVPRGGVLAVRFGAVHNRLVVRDNGFAIVPMIYVCASVDHRALDGMDAGAVLGALKRALERPAA